MVIDSTFGELVQGYSAVHTKVYRRIVSGRDPTKYRKIIGTSCDDLLEKRMPLLVICLVNLWKRYGKHLRRGFWLMFDINLSICLWERQNTNHFYDVEISGSVLSPKPIVFIFGDTRTLQLIQENSKPHLQHIVFIDINGNQKF